MGILLLAGIGFLAWALSSDKRGSASQPFSERVPEDYRDAVARDQERLREEMRKNLTGQG
jgi:hypothetical protein